MKCPKCGSKIKEKRDWVGVEYCISEDCEYCSNQARLDKVLAKFANDKNDEYVMQFPNVLCDDGEYHLIYYYEKKFRLYRDDNIIQLDTVELLLRDLGVDL